MKRARERNIIIPTFKQMQNPALIPDKVKAGLKNVGLWDLNPLNLFRITWHNEPVAQGRRVRRRQLPGAAQGAHRRGRAHHRAGRQVVPDRRAQGRRGVRLPGVPRLVTGQFDPTTQKAVWPSTGNYCRGGAYDSALLGCESIAILPEGMSRERFEWLSKVAGEVIATPGTESNVKEIFDKCWELRRSGQDLMIFNQFEEFGNDLWHYDVTGNAIAEVLEKELRPGETLARLGVHHRLRGHHRRGRLPQGTVPAEQDRGQRGAAVPDAAAATASARTASRASATSTCRGSTTSRTPTW